MLLLFLHIPVFLCFAFVSSGKEPKKKKDDSDDVDLSKSLKDIFE